MSLEDLTESIRSCALKYAQPASSSAVTQVRVQEKQNLRDFLSAPNAVSRRAALRVLRRHRKRARADHRRRLLAKLLRLQGGGFAVHQRRAQTVLSVPLPRSGATKELALPANTRMQFWRGVHAIPSQLESDDEWFSALSAVVRQQLLDRSIPLQLLEILDDAFEAGNLYRTIRKMKS